MWRGVMIFLSFVLILTGWGLYFYQRSVNRMYEEYLLDQRPVSEVEKSVKQETVQGEASKPEQVREEPTETVAEESQPSIDPHQLEVLMAEKEELNQKYSQLLARIEKIEQVYNQMAEENKKLKEELQKKDEKISMLRGQLSKIAREKQDLEVKLQSIEGEVEAVRLENKVLKSKITELNDILNSMDKLKQAMRDLKMRLYFERKKKREEARKHIVGNRGYVILNGRSTLGKNSTQQVAVEVIPVFD